MFHVFFCYKMDQSFTRIEVGCLNYYLLTKLVDGGKEGFDLTVCDGDQVWRQKVEASKVLSLAKALDTDVSDFACQTARALTGQAKSQDNFVYQAKPQGSNLQFVWKKHLSDGIKLGCLTLPKVTNTAPVMKEIFDLAVEQTMQLKVEISSLKSDNARLSSERRDALKLLDKCVSAKEDIETDLFQKFAAVLNDKKSKIRKLKSQVQEAFAAPTASTAVKESRLGSKGNTKNKDSRRNDSSEGDTDTGESGDESSKSSSYPTVATTEKSAEHQKPSSTVLSSSLLLEDGSEEFRPAAKRRRRRGMKPKESPAAKLVLPKVPSVKKTPSNSSRESSTSRRRLRQRASDKSLPDADDLMAEMEM